MAVCISRPSGLSSPGSTAASFIPDLSGKVGCSADRRNGCNIRTEPLSQRHIPDDLGRTLGAESFLRRACRGTHNRLRCWLLFLFLQLHSVARRASGAFEATPFREGIRSSSVRTRSTHVGVYRPEFFDRAESYRDAFASALRCLVTAGLVSWALPAHARRSRSENASVGSQSCRSINRLNSSELFELRGLLSPASHRAHRGPVSFPDEAAPRSAPARLALSRSMPASGHSVHAEDSRGQ